MQPSGSLILTIFNLFFKGLISLACLIFSLLGTVDLNAKPLSVSVRAKSAILYNPDNGAILFEKRGREIHHPASILKIATALFVLDGKKVGLDKNYVASKEALEVIHAEIKQKDPLLYPPYLLEHDGVTIGLKEGRGYSVEALLHGILLASGNDAANVLAEGACGSIDQFMQELNAYLKEKGILGTRFQNPHGLHHPAQVTTAHDMAKIGALCFEHPQLLKIMSCPSYEMENGDGKINNWLMKKYSYPKSIGAKTGYISRAGYNFVAAAEDNGRRLIAVLLGCEKGEDRYKDAITLFETAFSEKKVERLLFAKDHECFTHKIEKADQILKAGLDEDVVISYFPSEEMELNAKIVWKKLHPPIRIGKEVGRLVIFNEGRKTLISTPLYAENHLKKAGGISYLVLGLIGLGLVGSFQLIIKGRKLKKG